MPWHYWTRDSELADSGIRFVKSVMWKANHTSECINIPLRCLILCHRSTIRLPTICPSPGQLMMLAVLVPCCLSLLNAPGSFFCPFDCTVADCWPMSFNLCAKVYRKISACELLFRYWLGIYQQKKKSYMSFRFILEFLLLFSFLVSFFFTFFCYSVCAKYLSVNIECRFKRSSNNIFCA